MRLLEIVCQFLQGVVFFGFDARFHAFEQVVSVNGARHIVEQVSRISMVTVQHIMFIDKETHGAHAYRENNRKLNAKKCHCPGQGIPFRQASHSCFA